MNTVLNTSLAVITNERERQKREREREKLRSLSAFMDQFCAHAFGYRLEPVKSCQRQPTQTGTNSLKT